MADKEVKAPVAEEVPFATPIPITAPPVNEPLYNQNDTTLGRPPGIYLDQEELRAAEDRRAKIEKRQPDYTNMQPAPGVRLVPHSNLHEPHLAEKKVTDYGVTPVYTPPAGS